MSFSIRAIAFSELSDYIGGEDWKKARLLPITPERAHSQQKNPGAGASESALWVASGEDQQIVGFAGSLPGYDVKRNERLGWNTCWWVDPVHGREAALPLLLAFLKSWDMQVAFSEMTAHTHAIIDQLDFCNTREETMVQVMMRLPGHRLSSRFGLVTRLFSPAIIPGAFLVNLGLQTRLGKRGRSYLNIGYERCRNITEEIRDFIDKHDARDFYHRSMEEWKWLENNPWLVKNSLSRRRTDRKYPFSYTVRNYKAEWLLTRDEGRLTSVQYISVRNGFMKVLYYYGDKPEHAIGALIRKVTSSWKVYSVLLAHPSLIAVVKPLRKLGISSQNRSRWTGISRKIMELFPEDLIMQLGDGDAVFT